MFSKENKWLLAFLISCVVLVAAIVVAIVLGVKLGNANETPGYSEGDEVGIYYYDVADGEILLTLSGGNNFTIAGPGMNKTGTYVATEGGFTLDFVRDEDGEATATTSGDTVEVTLPDGTKMTFLKKVNYTVSFNVDGGSAVDSASVVNGKTALKPADPSKNGFVFLGWYSDEALTVPYSFESTVIKADTTVYAKWAQKGAEGSSEYTISFDLGYEGGEMASIETIGAKAYGVTVPERTGYTFCGWWISMYEDGSKLSYAYTDDTVFTADTTLYAVWHEDASTKLVAPKASVSGNSVKWDSVSGASTYKIIITDENGTEVANETVGSTVYSFNFETLPAGEYTVSVTALGSDASKNSEAAVRAYANKTLDRVTEFNVINGILVYNSVAGAERYYVTVDCGNPDHNHENFDNGSSTVFSILHCTMQKGGIKITVRASAKGYADSVSKTFVYEKNLAPITGVNYDAATDSFVWFPVLNATSYYVELTYGDKTYTANIGNKTSFSLANFSGEMTVKVIPVTDGYNSPDAATATYTKAAPAAPTGLTASGNVLSWNEVAGATSYIVKVNSATLTTETNSIDLTETEIELFADTAYTVSVQAVSDGGASAFCAPVTMGYLVMDSNLVYSQNTVYWTPVIGASNYLVRVNGGATMSVNGCSAQVKLTKKGINTIEVKYTDLGGSKWVSIQVYAYAVTYMSRSLSGDVTEYVAIGDNMALPTDFVNNGYDFDGWYNTPGGASGNGKKVTVATFSGTTDVILYANWTPKTYQVELQTGSYDITNITDKTKVDATYTKDFTLPVPVTTNTELGTFLGWYTSTNGDGEQLTDEDGNSVAGYPFPRDTVAYPFFDNGVLSYVLRKDDTYAVRRGEYIHKVKNVTIPETYNGKKVSMVLENGFADCSRLVSIEIPNTVELVGTGAFSGCTRLESINVYTVEGNHDVFYSSDDGVLVYTEMGTTYLEVVPRAKTGTYVMSEGVQVIRNKAFNYSKLTSVVLAKSVTTVASRAFNYCTDLESIDFIEGGTNVITFEDDSFYRCNNVKAFKVPAALQEVNINMLQSLTSLATISVEKGHSTYSSVGGLLTNNLQNTIVFAPSAYVSGDFTIPSGIQYVGTRAFEGCAGLTSVTVPNYVKEIGVNAFAKCAGVKFVTIEGDRKQNDLSIGDYAFAYCSKLATLTIGGSADGTSVDGGAITIGASAFVPTSSLDAKLSSVTIGNGANIAKIGDSAFANQSNLNTLSFGTATVTEIGSKAFENCSNLTSIIIPATTTSVGAYAFSGCSGIASVAIADGSTTLAFGEYAFSGCVRLTTVNLPASVTGFDGAVFSGCNALKTINVDPANTSLKSIDGVLYDYNVTTLKFYPVAIITEAEGVITAEDLPDTLTTIDKAVFSGYTALKSIVIEAGVRKIADEAFKNCTNLTSITFVSSEDAEATLSIGTDAFYKCPFTDISTLPDYVTTIGNYAFYGSKFASFPAPSKLTYIGDFAFNSNNKLAAITIPSKVSYVGNAAFAGCTALKSLTIEAGETELVIGSVENTTAASGAFYNTRLPSVTLPDRVVSIGGYAFTNNSTSSSTSTNTIRSFTAGAGLKEIGFGAFYRQRNLDTVTLNEGLVKIGKYAFSDAGYISGSTVRGIQSVTIPSTVEFIGTYAFGSFYKSTYYNALNSITFTPDGTQPIVIEAEAFAYSSLTSFEIPKRALAYAEGLETALYGMAKDSYGLEYKTFYQIFNNCSKLENITVEEGSTQFASIGGIVYTFDSNGVASTLLYCPVANRGVEGVVSIAKNVTLIENGAFYNTKNLTKVTFEEATEAGAELYLGNPGATRTEQLGIFCGSSNGITTLELPKHLKRVGSYGIALRGTSAAQDVTVTFNPEAVIELSENAIKYLDTLSLALPNVSAITGRDFLDAVTANTITFGANSTFTSFPSYAINECNNLTTFEIPASVVRMGDATFYYCYGLKTVTFASNTTLTEIGSSAFRDCTALESITFPSSVTTIGGSAFSGCTSLKTVVLPASLTSIPATLFNIGSSGYDVNESAIESVTFSGESSYFKVVNNAIYSIDGERLVYFPAGKSVDEFVVADGTKYIEDRAFYQFKGSEITLPAGLESIGENAFAYSKITSISVPDSITNIGVMAFYECRDLVTFTMSTNAPITGLAQTSNIVNNGVFQNCVSLKNVTLSDNIESLNTHAFHGCTSLETITLPANLKILNNHVFSGCTALSSIVIPGKVESIGNQAFYNASSLKSVIIPAAVTFMDNYAFYNASGLESIVFENNSMLETLGNQVFKGCASLKSVDLSVAADLNTIGNNLFEECASLESVKLNDTLITELGAGTFKNLTALTSVTLPETLEIIGNEAFAGASALESVVIPANVATIGTSAFENCTGLKTVTFEEGSKVVSLGTATSANDNIFKGTTALETVILPQTLEFIGGHVFENSGVQKIYQNNGIEEVSLPSALTTIGEYAFANCDGLTEAVIYGNTGYVGGYAFYDCNELAALTLSEGVSYIGSLAFGYCEKLEAVALPETITKLEGNPFAGCVGLLSFTLHEANTAYKFIDNILYDWTAYTLVFNPVSNPAKTLNLPDSVYEIAPGAFVGSKIETLSLPGKITVIPDYAFASCQALKTVRLSNSVTSIGNYAFEGCTQLNNVIVPKSVNTIGNYAFANCTALDTFVFEDKDTTDSAYQLGTHLFEGCTALDEVVVPNKLSTAYLPSYMFANTGLVNAVVPANITKLSSVSYYSSSEGSEASEGVFANNTKLESITFLGVDFTNYSARIGVKYFQNSTALKTVQDNPELNHPANILPTVGSYAFAGCTGIEYLGTMGGEIYIRPYAFQNCTGLKNFYFGVGESQDGVCGFAEIYDFAFQNCTGIEKMYVFAGSYSGQYMAYGKQIFDGWTANQTIVFLHDFRGQDGLPDASNWDWFYNWYQTSMLDGCSAQIVYRDDLFDNEVVTIDYCGPFGDVYFYGDPLGYYGLSEYTKVKTLNIAKLAISYTGITTLDDNAFTGFRADQTINFTGYTYKELLQLIANGTISNAAFKNCAATVCDKDGNVLVINTATGAVTGVKLTDTFINLVDSLNGATKPLAGFTLPVYDENGNQFVCDQAGAVTSILLNDTCFNLIATLNGEPKLLAGFTLPVADKNGNELVYDENGAVTAINAKDGVCTIAYSEGVITAVQFVGAYNEVLADYAANTIPASFLAGCNVSVTDKDGNVFTVVAETGAITAVTLTDTYLNLVEALNGETKPLAGLTVNVFDKDGNEFIYDETGAVIGITLDGTYAELVAVLNADPKPLAGFTLPVYDENGNQLVYDATGAVTSVILNGNCFDLIATLNGETKPLVGFTLPVYDENGNQLVYDATGAVTAITAKDGICTFVITEGAISSVKFDGKTYLEILAAFADETIAADYLAGCTATVTDKDGNVLVCDETGAVTSVTNADGSETLWPVVEEEEVA